MPRPLDARVPAAMTAVWRPTRADGVMLSELPVRSVLLGTAPLKSAGPGTPGSSVVMVPL